MSEPEGDASPSWGACRVLARALSSAPGAATARAACDAATLRSCTDSDCVAGWLDDCLAAPTPACREALAGGSAPEVLAALGAMKLDSSNQIASSAVEVACSLRPAGAASLFGASGSPRCRAAQLETSSAPAPSLEDGALEVAPYVQHPETLERFAPTLHAANVHRDGGRDTLFKWLCVDHSPETPALEEACRERGPRAEIEWGEQEQRESSERGADLARGLQRQTSLAHAGYLLVLLYAAAMWGLRRKAAGGALGYVGVVVAGVLASFAIPTSGGPPGQTAIHLIIVAALCALLGLVAFIERARAVVTLLVVGVSIVGLWAIADDASREAAIEVARGHLTIPEAPEPASVRPRW